MDKVFTRIFAHLCSEKSYSALFKAGTALLGVALLALYQAGDVLYDREISAYKAKYTLEVMLKSPLEKIDCSKTSSQEVDCLVAKQQMRILGSTFSLLRTFIHFCFYLGLACFLLSAVGFVCAFFYKGGSNAES